MDEWEQCVVDAKSEIDAGRHVNAINMMTSVINRMSVFLPRIIPLDCKKCCGSGQVSHSCGYNCPTWDCPKLETCSKCYNGKIWPGTETKKLTDLVIGDVLVEHDGYCLPIVNIDIYSPKDGIIYLGNGTEARITDDSSSFLMIRIVKKE